MHSSWTRTKVICTIGPAVDTYEKILELLDAGMNVARLNFSHGTHDQHLEVIDKLKKARDEKRVPLAIMLDTKGPEIRIGDIKDDFLQVTVGQRLLLVKECVLGDKEGVQVTPPVAVDCLKEGMKVLFDDGYIVSKVVENSEKGAIVEILNDGVLKTHKGVNIPDADLALPAMTEQDVKDIVFACRHDVDIIAASFICSAQHVLEIKKLLSSEKKSEILVIAKIENTLGLQHFDSILQVADGIMVARGDLGVELPLEQVPRLQKMMIQKCNQVSKPVVTATQMLESMIKNLRPTRAEVSDVANAIYDSTSAVMLSGETAVGKHPIESVKMMKSIILETEKNFLYREFFARDQNEDHNDVSSSLALACVRTAYSADAKAIFVFTTKGSSAFLVSRFRPEMPIFALTQSSKVYNQLAFLWGVIPVDPVSSKDVDEAFAQTASFALKCGVVQHGDLVTIVTGSPFGVNSDTNMMLVESIGEVLFRARRGSGKMVHGKVSIMRSILEHESEELRDKIVVLSYCNATFLNVVSHARGIILQNHPQDKESEKEALKIAKTLDISLLIRADGAMNYLSEGQVIVLDPEKLIVYKGIEE